MKHSWCWKWMILISIGIGMSSCSVLPMKVSNNVIVSDVAWKIRSLKGVLQYGRYIHPTNIFAVRTFPIGISGLAYYESGWIAADSRGHVNFTHIDGGAKYVSHDVEIMDRRGVSEDTPPKQILDGILDGMTKSLYRKSDLKPCVLSVSEENTFGLPSAYAKILLPENQQGLVRVSIDRIKRPIADLPANCRNPKQDAGFLSTTRHTDQIIHMHIVSLKGARQLPSGSTAKFLTVSTIWDYELKNFIRNAGTFDDGTESHADFVSRIAICGTVSKCAES